MPEHTVENQAAWRHCHYSLMAKRSVVLFPSHGQQGFRAYMRFMTFSDGTGTDLSTFSRARRCGLMLFCMQQSKQPGRWSIPVRRARYRKNVSGRLPSAVRHLKGCWRCERRTVRIGIDLHEQMSGFIRLEVTPCFSNSVGFLLSSVCDQHHLWDTEDGRYPTCMSSSIEEPGRYPGNEAASRE